MAGKSTSMCSSEGLGTGALAPTGMTAKLVALRFDPLCPSFWLLRWLDSKNQEVK